MRLFSRFLMVAGLLGGLAYGSYAFGKYVLSNRLFGPQGTAMQRHSSENSGEHFGSTVTRSSAVKGSPRAEIDVLPSDEAGDAPEPDLSSARRHTERRPLVDAAKKPANPTDTYDADGNPLPTPTPSAEVSIKPDDEDPGATPVPRHKRRKKHVVHEVKSSGDDDTNSTTGDKSANLPARAQNDDNPTHSVDAGPGPRDDAPSGGHDLAPPLPVGRIDNGSSHDDGDGNPTPKPHHHHRERIKRESVPAGDASDHPPTHRSTPPRRHEDSPVPRPEGDSGGGDSPVPLPG